MDFLFLAALLTLVLTSKFSIWTQHRDGELQNVEMDAKYFLNWSPARKNRVLKRLWQYFGLEEEHLDDLKLENGGTSDGQRDADVEVIDVDDDYRVFAIDFGAKVHFEQSLSHKKFILKVFEKLGSEYFPNVTKSKIQLHDNSKVGSFVEVVGYTEKWVLKGSLDSPAWQAALRHHYEHNPHHPEYHVDQFKVKKGKSSTVLGVQIVSILSQFY